jgi:hypothetical protein
MTNELAGIWKEMAVTYFKVLSQHLPHWREETDRPQSG